MTSIKDKKIAVIGIGGVGGYVAGLLAASFPEVPGRKASAGTDWCFTAIIKARSWQNRNG